MEKEKVLKNGTVCLLVKDGQVLLGLKKDKIGKDCFNGPGGGKEEWETIEQTALRELEEETGKKVNQSFITAFPEDMEKVAIMYFTNVKTDGSSFVSKIHFFLIRDWLGISSETDEMGKLEPYDINNLPFSRMMLADREFFPAILSGKKIIGKAKYGPYQKTLLEPVIWKEVDSFPDEN